MRRNRDTETRLPGRTPHATAPLGRICLFSRASLSIGGSAQDPVAERAVAAAKEYVKAKGLKDPKLTILLSSLYNNSFPDFAKKWEELTGVKFEIVPLGYTDIPAKIMQEAVSKTGVYDIFNDFPYTMPDAVGAKVIIPLDELREEISSPTSPASPTASNSSSTTTASST